MHHLKPILWLMLVLLIVSACNPAPTEAPPAPTDSSAGLTEVILQKESVGIGDPTITYTLTLDPAGQSYRVEDEADEADEATEGALSEAQISELDELIETTNFFAMDEDYIPEDGTCCDLLYYYITVTQGDTTHTVRASESTMPDAYREVLNWLDALP